MNTELGRKVLGHITTHREQFDMTVYGEKYPECGTVACIAGWAMLLSGYQLSDGPGGSHFIRPDGSTVPDSMNGDEAAELLDLTAAERYGGPESECSLFTEWDEDAAIDRFRMLVETPAPAAGED